MKTKIIKIGNAAGVIIPKKMLEEIQLKLGQTVSLEKDPTNKALMLRDKPRKKSSVTPEFLAKIKKINKRYEGAWKELAKL